MSLEPSHRIAPTGLVATWGAVAAPFGRFLATARNKSRETSLALYCSLPAIALALCVLSPYLGKAYTIDDTLFLRQAEHVTRDAMHPAAFDYYWSESDSVRRLASYMPSGPVMAWLLVPAVRLAHGEWLAHATQLMLFVAAIVATASVALRLAFGESTARLAALLLAASPVVLAMSSTCMPDTAAMTFGVLGIERALAWRESGRVGAWIGATASLALGALARSQALLLCGMAFLFTIASRPRDRETPRFFAIVAGPALALAAAAVTWVVFRLTRDPSTGADAVSAVANFHPAFQPGNAFALLANYALTLPFGFGMILTRPLSLVRGRAAYFALPTAFALSLICNVRDWLLIAAAASGLTALLDALGTAVLGRGGLPDRKTGGRWQRRADDIALALWLFAPFPIIYYLHAPAKYLLPSAPAAALLLAAALSARERGARALLSTALIAGGTLLGVLIVRADAAMAGLARSAATEIVAPAVAKGQRVWFAGHWGFQWYMEHAGARPILEGRGVRPGDLIVVTQQVHGRAIDWIARSPVQVVKQRSPGGRIMSGGAGFYSNAWGYYPWVWSDATDERIDLWRAR